MLGSQLVIAALRRQGVTTIFSLSGNQIMPLYDACIDAGIRIVHVRHEAAAVFMADAWAQVTGQIGVAMLTAGPGITNGIAPLYSAAQAESPVLLISGDSSVVEDGTGAFQEMDQVSITAPLTKRSHRPVTAEQLSVAVDDAIALAMAPRRGPVHLALPFDLLCDASGIDALPPLREAPAATAPAADVAQVASLLATASTPLILAGPSAARSHAQAMRDLQEALQAPLIAMESPRGLKDPAGGAMADLLPSSDLIVLAGKRLDFTLGFGREAAIGARARVIVIDPDPTMIDRAKRLLGERLVCALPCDPAVALEAVARAADQPRRADWRAKVEQALRQRGASPDPQAGQAALGPRELCERVDQLLASVPNPILICDGGEFGQWAQAYCRAPVRVINGMSGAIGGGLCYAVAAKVARPDATVVALMGDGTSGFHFMEFDTAVREQAPFVAVIGNDLRWNAEHLIQVRTYGPDRLIGCQLAETARYENAAAALGGFGRSAASAAELDQALRAAVDSGLPACINVTMAGQAAPVFSSSGKDKPAH